MREYETHRVQAPTGCELHSCWSDPIGVIPSAQCWPCHADEGINANEATPHAELADAAFDAGLVRALASHLHPSLTAAAAAAALKAAWICCSLAADSVDAAQRLAPLAPLLIAHLGGAYGPELVLQCAWALGNIAATGGPAIVATLLAQGLVPSLLAAMHDGARAAASESASADAASTCAWALCAAVESGARSGGDDSSACERGIGATHTSEGSARGASRMGVANALFSARPPCSAAICAAFEQHASAELATEAAWLAVHAVATGTPAAQQLCGAAVWPSVHCALVDALRHAAGSDGAAASTASSTTCSWSPGEAAQVRSIHEYIVLDVCVKLASSRCCALCLTVHVASKWSAAL